MYKRQDPDGVIVGIGGRGVPLHLLRRRDDACLLYTSAYGPLLEEFADQFCTSAETACSCGAFDLAEYTPLENWRCV